MRYPLPARYSGRKFLNEDPQVRAGKDVVELVRLLTRGKRKRWPDFVDDNVSPDFQLAPRTGQSTVTFINHATVLMQWGDLSLITDPVFSQRVGAFSRLGPKRHRLPGAVLEDLPKLAVVLISHNHYDHLDRASLLKIEARDHPLFVVPLGNKKRMRQWGLQNVIELNWGEVATYDDRLSILFLPMQHWSARGLFDRFETLWGGYLLGVAQQKVLFAGDSGYNVHFKKIEEAFGPMDLSLLPMGAYEPRWFMKDLHMNPEEAVLAHRDLKSKLSIGIHFGTFHLASEGIDDPIEDLKRALDSASIPEHRFLTPKNGETIPY